MNDEKAPPEFWERADEMIAVANRQMENATLGTVSSSLLYAAARFNAFAVTSSSESSEDMRANREGAVDYFVEQYRSMLIDNLDDHIENFDDYKGPYSEDA